MKSHVTKNPSAPLIRFNWRAVWYSVLLWLATFLISSFVILPWFYPAAAITVFLTTVYYFKMVRPSKIKRGRRAKADRDTILTFALTSALVWFLILITLNLLEIAGFYYFNFMFYFSDFRNWYLYALVLLVPVVYGLILENGKFNKASHKKKTAIKPLSSAKIIW